MVIERLAEVVTGRKQDMRMAPGQSRYSSVVTLLICQCAHTREEEKVRGQAKGLGERAPAARWWVRC